MQPPNMRVHEKGIAQGRHARLGARTRTWFFFVFEFEFEFPLDMPPYCRVRHARPTWLEFEIFFFKKKVRATRTRFFSAPYTIEWLA